ncbi:MAG: DUF5688 family protein [Lachnospiraceae bacterium]
MDGSILILLRPYLSLFIIVPTKDRSDIIKYTHMVLEVNTEQVEEEEILSDHAYYYDWDVQALSVN